MSSQSYSCRELEAKSSLQSWDTNDVKLRTYFENYGAVKEAFVSYARDGKPRGFGFVVFESSAVADRVVRNKHTIDRREVRRCARYCVWCMHCIVGLASHPIRGSSSW